MNTKTLILAVAKQTKLPVSQVEEVSEAVLRKFAALVETQGKFRSPLLHLDGVVSPARPATNDQPAKPERKFARLRIPPKPNQG